MIELSVQWAEWSKEPNDSRDYRILRFGEGRLSVPELGDVISRHIPGQPPGSRQPGPAALPWITFSPSPGDDGEAVGVSVLDLTDVSDFSSRRIAPTRYLRLPFEPLAAGPAGYAGMAAAALEAPLPEQGRAPLTLAVRPIDVDAAAGSIERLGFDRVAAVAGLVLDGRVVLLTERQAMVEERLAALDAIASLLPYGYRASLVASTWAHRGNDQVRLTFGGDVDPNARIVSWDAGAAPELAHGWAPNYMDLLRQLRDKHGLERLVAHLAGDREPRTFRDPRTALHSLGRLDELSVLSLDARGGTADPAAVRAFLDGAAGLREPPEAVTALTGFLLKRRQAEDIPRIDPRWTPALWEHLVEAARSELLAPSPEMGAWYFGLAARWEGGEERLLVALLDWATTRAYADGWTARRGAIRAARPRLPAAGDGWPGLAQRIGGRRELTYELLTQEVEEGAVERVPALLDWLRWGAAQEPAWLRPFQAALDSSLPALSEADLQEAAQLDPRHARALFVIARRNGRGEMALQAVWSWLFRVTAELTADQRVGWLEELEQLDVAGDQRPMVRARLDLLRLRFGSPTPLPLRSRLVDEGQAAAVKYLVAFEEIYRVSSLDRVRPDLARSLIGAIEEQHWTSPRDLAENVLALLGMVYDAIRWTDTSSSEVRAAAVRAVGNGVIANQSLEDLSVYRTRWKSLVDADEQFAAHAAVSRLQRELSADLSIGRLASLCAAAIVYGRIDDVLHTLKTRPHPLTGAMVHTFLAELDAVLRQRRLDRELMAAARESIALGVLEERAGRHLAYTYKLWLASEMPQAISLAALLVDRVKGELTPRQLEILREAGEAIVEATKRSLRDRLPFFRRRDGGRSG